MAVNRTLTREEVEKRIEADDGDPETEVYIRHVPKGRGANKGFTYHTDPACQHVAHCAEPKAYSRRAAQLRWKTPCLDCVLTDYVTRKP